VKEQGADVGISLDGDADRVIFSDASGPLSQATVFWRSALWL